MKNILPITAILFAILFGCGKDDNDIASEDDSTTGTFTDSRDGHVYNTVKIGDQTWMTENLAYLPSGSSFSKGSSVLCKRLFWNQC